MCGKWNKIYAMVIYTLNVKCCAHYTGYFETKSLCKLKKKRYLVDKTQWRYIHILL